GLDKQLTEPMFLAQRALQRKLSPYPKDDIRYVPTIEESIARLEAVTLEQVRQLYAEQLGGEVGEFVAVGDLDAEATPKQVQDILKDWKASVAYERIARPAKTDVEGGKENIITPDKANAMFFAGEMLALTDADPDYPALELANYILGGGFTSRLMARVRVKEGLSYGVGSMFAADSKDKSGRFMMAAITNPKNIDKVDVTVHEELNKFLKDGPSDKELTEAKKAYLQAAQVQRASDSRLVSLLADALFAGRTFDYYAELEKNISGLSKDEVTATFRKYIAPKKLVIVRAGDFKTK
ncbi:MAG TPA: insulinase family protein, partial [Gemmataceae bacterium]|nr:insulinase family protein [Gemmataceae bacterium]